MGDTNPFEEPSNTRLLNTGGSRSYGGSGGYQPKEVFGDSYVQAESTESSSFKPEQLQFQNFQHTSAPPSNRGSTISNSGAINSGGAIIQQDTVVDFGDEGNQPLAQGGEAVPGAPPGAPGDKAPETGNAKFWTIPFYRPYFNVDTMEVLQRILRSVTPFRFGFIETAKANPDFYGPFWIATTLVFILAIAGNIYNIIKNYKENKSDITVNFDVIVVGAVVFYGYIIAIPLILWGVLKYLKVPVRPLEILCIYGYSMFIYIPISLICVIPNNWLQWGLTIGACAWSGLFLVSNLMAAIKDFAFKRGIVLMIVVCAAHAAVALTYKLYFFEHAYKTNSSSSQ